MTHFDALSPRQRRAIRALMANRSQTAAAIEAGISRSTMGRWLASPEFNRALVEAEGQALTDTTRQLLAGKENAIFTLGALMVTANSESVRRQAANDWLALMYKSFELQDLESRIAALEALSEKE